LAVDDEIVTEMLLIQLQSVVEWNLPLLNKLGNRKKIHYDWLQLTKLWQRRCLFSNILLIQLQ